MFLIPELGGAFPIGDKLVVSAGFTSGFAPDYVFPADGPQRYAIIDNVIWNFQVGPAVSYRPHPMIAIGAGLQWQVLRVEEQLKVTTSGRDDPNGDVMVVASVWDKFTPSWNAGVLFTPIEQVSVGLSYQPPVSYTGKGDGYLDFTGHGLESTLDQTRWEDDDITLAIDMPAFVRAGVAYRPLENLEIEGDFVYETWSKLEDIIVSDIDVTVTGGNGLVNEQVEEQIPLPASFDDVWSVRFGAEYRASKALEVRAGGFYEDTSLTRQNVSVALVDTPKTQAGLGASWYFGRFALDGYASKVFYRKLEIRDSDVTQINVFDPSQEAVVGNGDLSSSGLALGLAGRFFFGEEAP
jgi:long-chain fatty acid transport protein